MSAIRFPINTQPAVRNPVPTPAMRIPLSTPASQKISPTPPRKSLQIRAPFRPPTLPKETLPVPPLPLSPSPEEGDILIPTSKDVAGPSGAPKNAPTSTPTPAPVPISPPPSSSPLKQQEQKQQQTQSVSTETEGKTPDEIIRGLSYETRERFYKTPTLGPYLQIIVNLAISKKQNPKIFVERFLKEYDSLVKNQPRMANILAYQKLN